MSAARARHGFDVDIEGLSQDTMRLEAELVEVRAKRTLPVGEIGHDAFGNVPVFHDHGTRRQGILAVGKQDVNVLGLTPLDEGVKIKLRQATICSSTSRNVPT